MSDDAVVDGMPAPRTSSAQPSKKERKPKKRHVGGRPLRRIEEDIPSHDYVAVMHKLGPRDGESLLAFIMRMGALTAGRTCLLEFATRCKGNVTEMCRQLGVNRHNFPAHLRQTGLTTYDIINFKDGSNSGSK